MAFADRILLNKTDLVTKAELRAVREELASINAYAEVIETVQSKVDLDKILGVASFSVEKTLTVDPYFLEEEGGASGAADECAVEGCIDEGHGHAHGGGHGHAHGGGEAACAVDGCADEAHGHAHGAKKLKAAPKKKRHDLSGVSSVGIQAEGELDFNGLNGARSAAVDTRMRTCAR